MINRFENLAAALKGVDPKKHITQDEKEQASDKKQTSETPQPSRRKERKLGKRSNPEYEQIGAYIPKSLHLEVKKCLLDKRGTDISDLITELLKGWVERN